MQIVVVSNIIILAFTFMTVSENTEKQQIFDSNQKKGKTDIYIKNILKKSLT